MGTCNLSKSTLGEWRTRPSYKHPWQGSVIKELRRRLRKPTRCSSPQTLTEGEAISWHLAHILKLDPEARADRVQRDN